MTTFRHHPLIGTFVEIQVDDDSIADDVEGVIVGEMERLESICSSRPTAHSIRRAGCSPTCGDERRSTG